jgi:hypothetical protein
MAELTLADLRRWEEHGATWRLLESAEDRVEIELCTCSGEAVDRVQGRDPELLGYVHARQPD